MLLGGKRSQRFPDLKLDLGGKGREKGWEEGKRRERERGKGEEKGKGE